MKRKPAEARAYNDRGTALTELARAVRAGERPAALPLPDEELLRPVSDAIREVQRALGSQAASGPDRAA